uniref:Uncharacterized protein n=1 Tax=Anguilla anguilla TaxID=7936 RepID=A0A0E9U8Q4_ANGAN
MKIKKRKKQWRNISLYLKDTYLTPTRVSELLYKLA